MELFKFVGRFVGKAIYDGQRLDAYFTRSFYKHILGVRPSYHDIEWVEPAYYKSLKWMLENDIDNILFMTFTAELDDFGKKKIVELKHNGKNINVTDTNKVHIAYIHTHLPIIHSLVMTWYGMVSVYDRLSMYHWCVSIC